MRFHAILLAAATLASPALAAPGLVSFNTLEVWPNTDNQQYSIGWSFSTTGQTVNALGYNNYGFSATHLVGIYDSAGNLLGSVTVTGTSTLSNGYRYTNLAAPLNLSAGTYFIAGTSFGNGDGWIYEAANIVTNGATTYLGSYFQFVTGPTLAFPANFAGGREYLMVNFETSRFGGGAVVPEPATWAMMIAGFGLVGAAMRRRHRKLA